MNLNKMLSASKYNEPLAKFLGEDFVFDLRGLLVERFGANLGNDMAHLGLDVYEEEADLFFEDLSDQVIQDDVFARLLTFPNVIITGHQGFFTEEALRNIAETTLTNLTSFEQGIGLMHEVSIEQVVTSERRQ